MLRAVVVFLVLLIAGTSLYAQVSIRDSTIRLATLNIVYRGMIPGGDMAERFGFTSAVGFEVGFKNASNWYLQSGLSFLFGGSVLEDSILLGITTPGGYIINDGGALTVASLSQIGFIVPVSVGKIIPVFPNHNPNSGIYLELGAQFIQHKIGISPLDQPVAALSKSYKKGYDRLTNGFGLRQGLGYRFFSNTGYVNFTFGLDLSQNFTQNRRSINLDTGIQDTRQRMDLLFGIFASWSFPIYNKASSTYYYN